MGGMNRPDEKKENLYFDLFDRSGMIKVLRIPGHAFFLRQAHWLGECVASSMFFNKMRMGKL